MEGGGERRNGQKDMEDVMFRKVEIERGIKDHVKARGGRGNGEREGNDMDDCAGREGYVAELEKRVR